MNSKTERDRAVMTDIDGVKREWFDAGFSAGCEFERERIKSVQGQAMPGHESLLESIKFDGVTTGEQAAVIIVQAERKKLARIGIDPRSDAGQPAPHVAVETTSMTTPQAVTVDMTKDEVAAIAKQEWANQPKLHREFDSVEQFAAFRVAESQGRIRVLDKRKGRVN
jgi:hypothetical protein